MRPASTVLIMQLSNSRADRIFLPAPETTLYALDKMLH